MTQDVGSCESGSKPVHHKCLRIRDCGNSSQPSVSKGQRLRPEKTSRCRPAAVLVGAMFSTPPWMGAAESPSGGASGRSVDFGQSGRSRSPQRNAGGGPAFHGHGGQESTSCPVTGNPTADSWFRDNVMDMEVQQSFLELPLWCRKSIVFKSMQSPPSDAVSWFRACVRNHRTNELEKQISGGASVHRQPLPGHQSGTAFAPSTLPAMAPSWQPPAHSGHAPPRASAVPAVTLARGESAEPPWTRQLLGCWPSQKSQLVGHLLSQLDEATQIQVQSLPPQTMAALGFCLGVAGTSDASATQQVQMWLRRVGGSSDTSSVESPRSIPAELPAAGAIQLQLILVVPNHWVGLVLAKTFVHVYEKVAPRSVTFLPLVVACSEGGDDLTEDDFSRLRLSHNRSVNSTVSLERFVENNAAQFKRYGIKTLMVTVLSAVSHRSMPAGAVASANPEAILHKGQFRHMWPSVKHSNILRGTTGDDTVSELLFAPPDLPEPVQAVVSNAVGPKQATSLSVYNNITVCPLVFACPTGLSIVKCCQDHDSSVTEVDGWKLETDSFPVLKVPTGLATHIMRLVEVQIFKERPLTEAEDQQFSSLLTRHNKTGEVRLCSREFWLRWWGFAKTPMQKEFDHKWPCHQTVFAVTGLPSPPNAPSARPCGKDRYCKHCEHVLVAIEAAYSLPTMVDAMVAMTTRSVQAWQSADTHSDDLWQRRADINRMHVCGDHCSFA